MRETRGTFLEFNGAEINKREVSVLTIIFRVPMMRQNQREWQATDVNMNYVRVAETHQRHLLLFLRHYTLNDKTHTCAHLRCQLKAELGLLRGCFFFCFFFFNHTYFIISRKQRINIFKILPQSLLFTSQNSHTRFITAHAKWGWIKTTSESGADVHEQRRLPLLALL